MSRRGQCPACFRMHSLENSQLPTVVRCDCGTSLFASDAHAFQAIPVRCHQCKEFYLVDPEDIGQKLECECGAEIEVFDTVLRLPIKTDHSPPSDAVVDVPARQALSATDSVSADPTGDRAANLTAIVSCPACATEYEVESADLNEIAACDCGATFVITNRQGQWTAVSVDQGDSSAATQLPLVSTILVESDSEQAKHRRQEQRASRHGHRKRAWMTWIGAGCVIAFFLISLGLFLSKRSRDADGNQEQASVSDRDRQGGPSLTSASIDNKAFEPSQIEPGQLAKLAAEVPVPVADRGAETSRSTLQNASLFTSANEDGRQPAKRSPFGERTVRRQVQLPDPAPARERIPIIPVQRPRRIFQGAYQDAFESYEELMAMEPDSEGYRNQLGETIALTKHAFDLAQKSEDSQKQTELCYLLAYLSHTAGHLVEASLYGEMAARWGDADDPATHEAAMIALAATQEANHTQWGNPKDVGELKQMQAIAEIVDQKWPKDPQRNTIWLNLAQTYNRFDQPRLAAEAFLKLDPSSDDYESALLAAGGAYWSHFLDRASVESPDPKEMVAILKTASQQLRKAVTSIQKQATEPTLPLLSAKLTLASIAERLGDPASVVQWLTEEPLAVTASITTGNRNDGEGKVQVDEALLRSVYSLLYRAKKELQDLIGASQALEQLAVVTGPEQTEAIGRMHLTLVAAQIRRLAAADTITSEEVVTTEQLLEPLNVYQPVTTASNHLWLAESWAMLATKATQPQLASNCYRKAADCYALAMEGDDFAKASLQSAMLRRAELLRLAGSRRESLDMLSSVLETTPNLIDLQLQAARTLQELAITDETDLGLRSAILGPVDSTGKSLDSPVWGWAKLATTLHQLRYSDSGTPRHAEQLIESQYHLSRCQWLLANVTRDPAERDLLQRKARNQVTQLLATAINDDPSMTVWRDALEQLRVRMESTEPYNSAIDLRD